MVRSAKFSCSRRIVANGTQKLNPTNCDASFSAFTPYKHFRLISRPSAAYRFGTKRVEIFDFWGRFCVYPSILWGKAKGPGTVIGARWGC